MSDLILYTPRVSPNDLIRESFSTHLKASKITFSLLFPVFIDLEKQLQKREIGNASTTKGLCAGDIFDAFKKKSGKWLSGILSCCLHTTAALALSRIENMTCQRIVFLYRLQPKLSPFYIQKLVKAFLPKSVSTRFFKKSVVDSHQAQYIIHSPDMSVQSLSQRFLESSLRRGLYALADIGAHVIGMNFSLSALTKESLKAKFECQFKAHDIKYAIVYHGGAFCAGSLVGFLGQLCASNEGEYWGELFGSILWMKWIHGIHCE